jgi:hypothetical protein
VNDIDTPEPPPPLTEREKAELACFHGAFGINHRALGRMRWLEAEVERMTAKCNAALDARDIAQRTLDGIDGVLSQRTAERDTANAERGELRTTVKMVADLAHAGGLSGKDIHEIFIAIRGLTVDMWEQRGTIEEKTREVHAAFQEGFRRAKEAKP